MNIFIVRFRRPLISAAALVAAFALPIAPQALAQQDDESDALAEVEIEEIVVTGSRIKRAGVDTFYPTVLLERPNSRTALSAI